MFPFLFISFFFFLTFCFFTSCNSTSSSLNYFSPLPPLFINKSHKLPQIRYSALHFSTLFFFHFLSKTIHSFPTRMTNTGEEGKSTEMIAVKVQKFTKAAQISLRFMAMAVTIAASCIVLSTKETVSIYGITADAKYSYSPTYK